MKYVSKAKQIFCDSTEVRLDSFPLWLWISDFESRKQINYVQKIPADSEMLLHLQANLNILIIIETYISN